MKLLNKLYFMKLNILFDYGMQHGLIVPFSDFFYEKLNRTIMNTIPVGLDIKYLKPMVRPGKCYDRSLKMFFAMDDSELVRGSLEYFRIQGDEVGENHGWVEKDGCVYDPTWLARFDKDFYYKIFKVTDVNKCNHEEYCAINEINKEYYESVKNTTRESFKEEGKERFSLAMTIPILRSIADSNEDFKRELNKYLEDINYDEEAINERIDSLIEESMIKGL